MGTEERERQLGTGDAIDIAPAVSTGSERAAEPARDEGPLAARPSRIAALSTPNYAIPILVMLGTALYLVNLGGYPLYTKGEPREAVTIFNIVHGGGLILPQRAGVEIPSKPLLMHWMAALASIALGGVTEFTVRLPSAMLAIAGILVCYLYVRRLFDDEIGFVSALILATTFQYLQAGTGARVDMTLTVFMEVAFFEFILIANGLTSRRMLWYAAVALAVLAKGPVGLLLPALTAIIWIAVARDWSLLRRLSLIRGAIVVAVLAGGWYAAATYVGGVAFLRKQLLAENLSRFIGGADFQQGHAHPFYYVEAVLLTGFMPWTFVMLAAAIPAWRRARPLDSRTRYLIVWFLTVLIFYNLARSKRSVYLLALYPALATLVSIVLAGARTETSGVPKWISALSRGAGGVLLALGWGALVEIAILLAWPHGFSALLAIFGIVAPAFVPTLSEFVNQRLFLATVLPVTIVAIGIYLLRARPLVERMVLGIAGGMACVALAANVVVVPAIADTLALKDFSIRAMEIVDLKRVGYLGALNYDVAFYSRRNIPLVSLRDANLPEYLICWRANYFALSQIERYRFTVVLTSNPTSLDGHDAMVLLRRSSRWYPPSNDTGTLEVSFAPAGRFGRYDAVERRNSETARTSRGSTSADPPRRLKSQNRVSSDS
ncbi:MAG TPA: glycosyltransferase family 39 protein [Candidatus Binataceae bacterium]